MKALIIADGSPPPGELVRKHSDSDIIIAADGGLHIIQKLGLKPDFLIGDFDSADIREIGTINQNDTRIIQYAVEKNETDGMIALNIAFEQGAFDIVMLGALGKRTDHALANIMLLKYARDHGAQMIIEDEYCEVSLVAGETVIRGYLGQTVSILPFAGSATVSSDNSLHYHMERLFMGEGDPVGISNILESEEARITIDQGMALLFKIK
jgi:thiamine pyrophosphokinase